MLNVTLVSISMFACFQWVFLTLLFNTFMHLFLLMFLTLRFSIHQFCQFQTTNGTNIAIYPLQRISDTRSISARFRILFLQCHYKIEFYFHFFRFIYEHINCSSTSTLTFRFGALFSFSYGLLSICSLLYESIDRSLVKICFFALFHERESKSTNCL